MRDEPTSFNDAAGGQPTEAPTGAPVAAGQDGPNPASMTKKDPIVFGVLSDRGWILERLAREIARIYPNFSYGTEIEGTPDIVYYMTYSARRVAFDGIEIGYFTHIEEGLPGQFGGGIGFSEISPASLRRAVPSWTTP